MSDRVEKLLIPALFGAVGVYVVYTSLEFPSSARVWPLMVSVVLVLGCGLLLFERYLPGPLAALTAEERIIGADQELEQDVEEENEAVIPGRLPLSPTLFTAVAIIGYAVLGYLIGLLWATPLFVAGYLAQFERPRWLIAFLSVLSFALAFGFMDILFLSIDSGLLTPRVNFP